MPNMLNSVKNKHFNCEQEAKFIQDRIASIEKHMAQLVVYFSEYSRKAASLRDKTDEIARITSSYSEQETINKSLSNALANFGICLTKIGDFGDIRVMSIDNKVVNEFAQYDGICRRAKEEVKQIYAARERELSKKKQLERIKERNPRSRQEIMQAESDVLKATAEVSRTVQNLEEQTTTFERQKLHDIKSILLDFITTEIGYHAKIIEVMTDAYQAIDGIQEENDLKDFKQSLHSPEMLMQQKSGTSIIPKQAHSLGSLSSLFVGAMKKHSGIPPPKPKSLKENTQKNSGSLNSMKKATSESETSSDDDDEEEGKESPEATSDSPSVIRKYTN